MIKDINTYRALGFDFPHPFWSADTIGMTAESLHSLTNSKGLVARFGPCDTVTLAQVISQG